MGANFETQILLVQRDELQSEHGRLRIQALHEDGYAGYTGAIAGSPGLSITDEVFDSEESASAWLMKNTNKWENTLAVQVKMAKGTYWMFGGRYGS